MTGAMYSPAVEHALATGRTNTAAAIHVLDGIHSDIFPREAVTMAGIDWKPIGEAARLLSSGESALVDAADELDHLLAVRASTLADVRRTVDADGNRRVDEAMLMAGQRIPATVTDYSDPLLDESARETFWDRR